MSNSIESRRIEVGEDLYRHMMRAEESIQTAMEHSAEFAAALARAPRQASLALGYGQGVVARVARVGGHLAEARGELVTAHSGLEKIREALSVGLTFEPFGAPADKEKPPTGEITMFRGNRDAA